MNESEDENVIRTDSSHFGEHTVREVSQWTVDIFSNVKLFVRTILLRENKTHYVTKTDIQSTPSDSKTNLFYLFFFVLQVKLHVNDMDIEFPNQIFINNDFMDSEDGKTFDTINPADESVICKVSKGTKADVDTAVAAAKVQDPTVKLS